MSYERAVRVDSALFENVDLRQKLEDDEETGLRGYLLTLQPAYLAPYYTARRALPAARAIGLELVGQTDPLVISLNRELATRGAAWERWAQAILDRPAVTASFEFLSLMQQGKSLFDRYRATAAALQQQLSLDRQHGLEASNRTIDAMNHILAGVFGGAILLLLIVGFVTVRSVTKPLHDLSQAARNMELGDLSQPVHTSGVQEFSVLADTMENMRLARKSTEEALGAKTREQETFIYTVSHDLRAPLVSLQGLVSIFAEDYGADLDDTARTYLARIDANASKMQALLSDLLDLARIGRVETEFDAIDLGEIVAGVIDQLGPTLDSRAAQVNVDLELPLVRGNATRLAQLFTNLIDNAVHYTPPERRPLVLITAQEHERTWEVSVADNGIGIPAESRKKVLALFQRLPTGKTLNPGGTGAGLAIVSRVVEVHGGELWIEPNERGGATFRFTLAKPEAQPPTMLPSTVSQLKDAV